VKTTSSIFAHRYRSRSTKGDDAIRFNVHALARYCAEIDAMNQSAFDNGDCCASCAFGDRFFLLVRRAERCRAWLVMLLRKRDRPNDRGLANTYESRVLP